MSQTTQSSKSIYKQTDSEQILVVKRNHLFPHGAWSGLKTVDFDHYLHIINHKKEFQPRILMEQDITYKQIIPYLIFNHGNNFFLMQRRSDASEKRLANKYTLGIGGHIRQEDTTSNSIFEWARREFHEEVDYDGNLSIKSIGIINDDANDVGKVHIGFALLLTGDSPDIRIKSELKSGTLITLEECKQLIDQMESWSQYVMLQLEREF